MSEATKSQVGGCHYKDMPIQPAEFIHKNGIGFLPGNVIKYVCRHAQKGGAEDIRKAIHYCQLILELEYGERATADDHLGDAIAVLRGAIVLESAAISPHTSPLIEAAKALLDKIDGESR